MPKFFSDAHLSGTSTDLTIDGSLNLGSADSIIGDATATGNGGLLLSSGQSVFITIDSNGTGGDEFRVGHGSGHSSLLSITTTGAVFAGNVTTGSITAGSVSYAHLTLPTIYSV